MPRDAQHRSEQALAEWPKAGGPAGAGLRLEIEEALTTAGGARPGDEDTFYAHDLHLAVSALADEIAHDLNGPLLFLRYLVAEKELNEVERATAAEAISQFESLLLRLRTKRISFSKPVELPLAPVINRALSRVATLKRLGLQVAVEVSMGVSVCSDPLVLEGFLFTLMREAALVAPAGGLMLIRASDSPPSVGIWIDCAASKPAESRIDSALSVARRYGWTVDASRTATRTAYHVHIPKLA